MYQRISGLILHLFRVPPEPHPPQGDAASLRVFRAGRSFFKLKLIGWGLGQIVAFAGILFWMAVFIAAERGADEARERRAHKVIAPAVTPAPRPDVPVPALTAPAAATVEKAPAKKARPVRRQRTMREILAEGENMIVQALLYLPSWTFPAIWVLKILGLIAYFAQLPVTYLIARMDFEMRWYLVTDRSLRIRHGMWKVSESTMSFVNIQQVLVTQGPLQRLLGIADVRVQSAGGGSRDHDKGHGGDTLHTAVFHAVENADEIRDLILARLRQFRATGLGDPDDSGHHVPIATTTASNADQNEALAAARELLAETRALRRSLIG